jgi:hypothetical protein
VVSRLKDELAFSKKCKMEYDNSLAVEKLEAKEFEQKREEDLRDLVKKVAGHFMLRSVNRFCQKVVSPGMVAVLSRREVRGPGGTPGRVSKPLPKVVETAPCLAAGQGWF